MTYLNAFLLGGLFCLLTQLLFRLTKWSIPVILTVAFCLRPWRFVSDLSG